MSPGDGATERIMLRQSPPATDLAPPSGSGLPMTERVMSPWDDTAERVMLWQSPPATDRAPIEPMSQKKSEETSPTLQTATDLWKAAGARRARRGSIEGHQPAGRDGCQLRIRRFCAGRGVRARAKREAGLMLANRLQTRTLK